MFYRQTNVEEVVILQILAYFKLKITEFMICVSRLTVLGQ